jgi:chromosome segregation ATPase
MTNHYQNSCRERREMTEDQTRAPEAQCEEEVDSTARMIGKIYERLDTLGNRLNKNPLITVFELSARLETLEHRISDMQDELRESNASKNRLSRRVDTLEATSSNVRERNQPSGKSRKVRRSKKSSSLSSVEDNETSAMEETSPVGRRGGMHRTERSSYR